MGAIDIEFLQLIGAIYDAVLDASLWADVIEQVRKQFDFCNGVLAINLLGYGPSEVRVCVNIPETYQEMMASAEYGNEVMRLWGGGAALAALPLEEPIVLSRVTDPQTWETNRYYRDFAEPQGIADGTTVFLAKDRRSIGNLAFGRHREAGPITDRIVEDLRLLAPHLRRAVLISGILGMDREKSVIFEAAVDAAQSAAVFVEGDGRIVHANPAAQVIMARGDPLASAHGRIVLRGEVVPGQLEAAIRAAAQGDVLMGRRGIAIPGRRGDGTPYVAHVLPLADRTRQAGLPTRTVAAVFIADRADDPQHAVDAATLIYGLTPTEARVFELILGGHPTAEIGRMMSIAQSTLKWHTLQLFDKTGQHRRADLVRLAGQLRPPG